MLIEVGLSTAKEGYRKSPESEEVDAYRQLDGPRVLTVLVPDGLLIGEAFRTLTDAEGTVGYHSDDPPTWVACIDSPAFAALLAEHFGCPVGKPDDVEATHWTLNGPPGEPDAKPVDVDIDLTKEDS